MFVLSLCLFGWAEKSRRRNWEKIILTLISRSSLWGGSTASGTFAGWLFELDSMRKISLMSVSASCGSEWSAVDFSMQQYDISKLHIKHPCLPTCLWFLYPNVIPVFTMFICSIFAARMNALVWVWLTREFCFSLFSIKMLNIFICIHI